MRDSTITVLGAGYVGLTSAVLFAHAGYKVYLIEPNSLRLDVIKQGRSFFYEQGIDNLIAPAIKDGSLIPTDSYEESIPNSTIVFSCVGTPDQPDGSSNLSYVFGAANKAAELMQPDTVYVQKSTVPVGTGQKIEDIFAETNKTIYYSSNPEFLREGTALYDTLYFDRIVVGGNHQPADERVLAIYKKLQAERDRIAQLAGIKTSDRDGEYIDTDRNSAELIKVTSNAFLALKISFANSIAKLADAADADVKAVMNAVGADARIGRAFLNAGRGYGGGCFPKDVSGLIASGLSYGVDMEIMQAAQNVNSSMPGYIIQKLRDHHGEELIGRHITILGLAFKAGTSDVRKSPGIALANRLAADGAIVTAWDPAANEEAREELKNVKIASTKAAAIKGADAIVIATEWPELSDDKAIELYKKSGARVVVDAINQLEPAKIKDSDLTYLAIGRR